MRKQEMIDRGLLIGMGAIAGSFMGAAYASTGAIVSTDMAIASGMALGGLATGIGISDTFSDFVSDFKKSFRRSLFIRQHPDFDKTLVDDTVVEMVRSREDVFRRMHIVDENGKPFVFRGKTWKDFSNFRDLANDYLSSRHMLTIRLDLSKKGNHPVYDENDGSLLFTSGGKNYRASWVEPIRSNSSFSGVVSFDVPIQNFTFLGQPNSGFAALYTFKLDSGFNTLSKESIEEYHEYKKRMSYRNSDILKRKVVEKVNDVPLELVIDKVSQNVVHSKSR